MRRYLQIDLGKRSVASESWEGDQIAWAGRYRIARTLNDCGAATVDPLSPDNPLIFSAAALSGTNFSNANRLSVGCKSPLTGGIKESNSGGTFALAMGHLQIAGFTLHGAADDWVVLRIPKEGEITFEPADEYLGLGNNEAARRLFERYGKKVSLALCGPVGEYQGLLAGIAFTDPEGRPARLAARGGIGAVLGMKKVKAIVIDLDKMPPLHDRKKVIQAVRGYNKAMEGDQLMGMFAKVGTAMMADVMNMVGGLPVNNYSRGQQVDTRAGGTLKMGGAYIRERNESRGGEITHACMPGCNIQCSNVYADTGGEEIVSPLEYETIALLGTNCGITDPDDVARMNAIVNDLGCDTIETGATLAVLMEAGKGEFGDTAFMERTLDAIRRGTEEGRLYAQGTARVGAALGITRLPVIKKQAIGAYDPRVVEVTGVSMMTTAMGGDHTAGNEPGLKTREMSIEEMAQASYKAQVDVCSYDSVGLCIFGKSITKPNAALVVGAMNDALGCDLPESFLTDIGRETLRLEYAFNRAAGFTDDDDDLPDFFYEEPLPPTNRTARARGRELGPIMERLRAAG